MDLHLPLNKRTTELRGLRRHMLSLSVLGSLPVYARFTPDGLVTPSHCLCLKRSPQEQLGFSFSPSQSNCFKSYCKRKDTPYSQVLKGFSALQQEDSPWESDNIWTNLSLYLFTLHIPLSFGGLSVVSLIAQQPLLQPQTQAVSLLTIQVIEFSAALVLLKYTAKPQYQFSNFFKNNKFLSSRNWFLSAALGFGFIVLIICLTSLLADAFFGSKPVNNPILKEILLNSDISKVSCVLAYCIVTPLLEEVVYRGFLLTSLSSTMEWQQAVIISSVIFSAIHFSAGNFLQLFIIGCVLGSSYCWTGNLKSSIVLHSLYNALTLLITWFY